MSTPPFDDAEGRTGYRSAARIDFGLGVWRENGEVAMRKNPVLPDRCVRCNAHANGFTIPQVIMNRPRAAEYAVSALLLGVLGFTVVRYGTYHTTIDVGLCDTHRRILRLPRVASIVLIVLAIPTCLTAVSVERHGILWILLCAVLGIVGAMLRSLATNPLRQPRIDAEGRMWFSGLSPAFVASLAAEPRDVR